MSSRPNGVPAITGFPLRLQSMLLECHLCIFFGYNPELTSLNDAQDQNLNAGFVDYHDKRIVKLFLYGLSAGEVTRRFSSIQPVREDVESVLSDSFSEFEKREEDQNLTIRVSLFFRKSFSKTRLFYTYNHPANAVLY